MNAQELGLKPGQALFKGDYRANMFELMRAGYTPWSPENIMDAHIKVFSSEYLLRNYLFGTDFGIAGTKKRIHLMPHSARLRAITPTTELTNGGIPLARDGVMKTYDRSDLILGRELSEEEARTSPVWLDFAAGDQNRLDRYVENTFRFGKDYFGHVPMMEIFVPEDKVERAVMLFGLIGKSLAFGGNHLSNNVSMVGVSNKNSYNDFSAQKSFSYLQTPMF